MKKFRKLIAFAIVAAVVFNAGPAALACGPGYIEPVFSFERSPDIPFEEYAGGNIGIIRPKFGDKALVVAFRYLNGGGFDAAEQKQIVDALRAKQPEDTSEEEAVKAWLKARQVVLPDEKPSEIYTEKPAFGGYNFFPNCTANAFEVAAETLRDRAHSHGADDPSVREWLEGQDRVFDICSSGSAHPKAIGPEMPDWLKKDRAYQIAAAHFYALNFDEAHRRFDEISADGDSPWQETSDYLVGRTLVREASMTEAEPKQRGLYEQAEQRLQAVAYRGGRFGEPAEKLLNMVKYRIRPRERVGELSRTLSYTGGNRNLRQDLIDHSWLMGKFEAEVISAIEERERKKREEEEGRTRPPSERGSDPEKESEKSPWEIERDALESGKIIRIGFSYQPPGKEYPEWVSITFPFEATDEQILSAFAERLGRELKEGEAGKILEEKKKALEERRYYLGANFRLGKAKGGGYEGGHGSDTELTSDAVPAFLRGEDLTDWMMTFRLRDEAAYRHSVAKFGESRSNAWLIAALSKAKKDSPEAEKLIEEALKVGRSHPAYASAVYHAARLMLEQGKDAEAGKILDELIASGLGHFPISARNMLLDLRVGVSKTLDEFLRFAGRRPVAFDDSGHTYGRLRDFYENEKTWWDKDNYKETKEEYLRDLERRYAALLPWDERTMFDARTIDVFNRHFPLDLLAEAALSKELPEHLRAGMIETVWTRAVLLGRGDVAERFAGEAAKAVPEMAETFKAYLSIKAPAARRSEELWILLRNPRLTAFATMGIPKRGGEEPNSWEDAWWAEPSDTYYERGEERPKAIPKPAFVTAKQSADAKRERDRIFAAGDAETYLTQRVFAWASSSPRDPRIPEALYVVAVINLPTKYGNGNMESRNDAIKWLETRFPNSPWTAKARAEEY